MIKTNTLIAEVIDMINADAFADVSDIQEYYNSRFDASLAPITGDTDHDIELTGKIAIKSMQLFRVLFAARVALVNSQDNNVDQYLTELANATGLKPDAVDTSKTRGAIIAFGSAPDIMNGGRLFNKYFNR